MATSEIIKQYKGRIEAFDIGGGQRFNFYSEDGRYTLRIEPAYGVLVVSVYKDGTRVFYHTFNSDA